MAHVSQEVELEVSREFFPIPNATTQGMTQSARSTRQANPLLRGRAAGTLLESYENCSQMARRLLLRVENRSRGSRATNVTQVTRSFGRSVFVAQRVACGRVRTVQSSGARLCTA